MARNIVVGIDIGTYQVKVVVTEGTKDASGTLPHIIGVGSAESKGLRHGYIINNSEVVKSIGSALRQAEKTSQVPLKRAFISVGGIGLSSVVASGSTIVTRADSEITNLDIKKAEEAAENEIPQSFSINRKIIHAIPLQYRIDSKPILGSNPLGMKGVKLEARMLFITCLEHHLNDLIQAVEEAGIQVQDVIASPIAASFVTLSKSQKIAGCVLANIGAETVSISVFENNIPVSLEIFPIGSTDITNDIALGLKVPLEEAEQIKIGAITGTSFPRKKLEEIVSARLSDIFELIEAHLKKMGRNGLLPAGIIITGGGAGIGTIEDMAKIALRLPSKIAPLAPLSNAKDYFKDASWAVAYGLCIVGLTTDDNRTIGTGMRLARTTKNNVLAWIKQFLP